jgi:hypothetical protein
MIPKVGFLVVKDTEDNSKRKLPFLLGSNFYMKVKENLEYYSETDKMNLIGKRHVILASYPVDYATCICVSAFLDKEI